MTDKLTDNEFEEICNNVPFPNKLTDWETDIFDKLDHIMLVGNFKGEWMNLIKSEIKKAVEEVSEVGITRYLDPILNEYDYEFDLEDILKSRGIE